ncbi:formimidoylglutamase [Paracrocinitomix mangrovi]|uniref:formimidoylglutamase n=1 Tax=Paracrocinitomix mangrovi TaxID=2862509 RepID=UPI001C8E76BA|nr:formimidoylglutamase [Paracrocinitomix mangrovi]UKN03289.1 formimidoylglutamase [Paracrocinitomix mangrovi]
MKDLGIYFSNYGDNSVNASDQLGKYIKVNSEDDFNLPGKFEIALLFVPEYRNGDVTASNDLMNEVRHQLYRLFPGKWKVAITDLGIISPGNTVEDTYAAVKDVVTELIKNQVFPVVVGGSQDLTYPIFQAYQTLEQTVNILDVDPGIDMGDPDESINARGWLSKVLMMRPNYLFNYSLLGYQSYLIRHRELDLVNKLFFDAYRLGDFYSNPRMVEPLVRNADILSFDMDAIRGSDYSGNSRDLPHGLYGEDACRIMRYAGLSDKLTSLGIFNLNGVGNTEMNANLVAQMIWYFIEGYENRKRDYPIGSKSNYTKYLVSIDNFKDEIVFYKSDKSGRWWMEVPYPKVKGAKFQRHLLVPCDYEDYKNALTNEMPNLWWRTFEKLS